MNASIAHSYHDLVESFQRDKLIQLLYLVFLAQDSEILSAENKHYAACRLGHEPTLQDLVEQWMNYGGLQHYWETHGTVAVTLQNHGLDTGKFNHFQIYFVLSNDTFQILAEMELGHCPSMSELLMLYQDRLAARMREQMDPAICYQKNTQTCLV